MAVTLLAVVVGMSVGTVIALTGALGSVEEQTLAARFALRHVSPPKDITIVGIDDPSFGMLHRRWPFPRSWHARVIQQLHEAGARAIFVDIQFTEPTSPPEDLALFHALGRTGGAVLATTEVRDGHSNVLGGDANLALVHSVAAAAMLPVGAGGVVSQMPYREDGLPSPALAIVERLRGGRQPSSLPGDEAYIDYRGPAGTFPELRYADVLRGRFDRSLVRGRVIVIGSVAPSLQDTHATPTSNSELMSGPELQANAIWTLMHGVPLRAAPLWLTLALITLASLLAPLTRFTRSSARAIVAVPVAAAAYLLCAQLAFDGGLVLSVTAPLGALMTAAVATVVGSHLLVNADLRTAHREIILRLARAAESRDGGSARHLERMGFLCEKLARAAGFSRRDAHLIRQASALHDVGKIAIPDEVLLKTGSFDAADRLVMNEHAELGARMLTGSGTDLVRLGEEIARGHHERWDGHGYPNRLRGEEIPLPARICAICDVFDALISRRRYKRGWSLEESLEEIRAGAGTAFDPDLVDRFLSIAPGLYTALIATGDPDLTPLPGGAEPIDSPQLAFEHLAEQAAV